MDDPSSPSDHWFDPWATCEGPHLKALSEAIARQVLQAPTKGHQARIRQPKQEQVERVTNIVSCTVANLAAMLFLKYISDVWKDHYETYRKEHGGRRATRRPV